MSQEDLDWENALRARAELAEYRARNGHAPTETDVIVTALTRPDAYEIMITQHRENGKTRITLPNEPSAARDPVAAGLAPARVGALDEPDRSIVWEARDRPTRHVRSSASLTVTGLSRANAESVLLGLAADLHEERTGARGSAHVVHGGLRREFTVGGGPWSPVGPMTSEGAARAYAEARGIGLRSRLVSEWVEE